MLLKRGWEKLPQGSAVAIGFFDGFHRGHQRVLARAFEKATPERPLCVMTFYPHPQTVFRPREKVKYLTLYGEKYLLLEDLYFGSFLAFLRFDHALRTTSPWTFLEMVERSLRPQAIFVGENFRFGFKRQGDSALLQTYFIPRGVEVVVVPSYREGKEVVSSSRIRGYLLSGQLTEANTLLGFSFPVIGRVRKGRRIGRVLGFPTLNLYPSSRKLLPPPGVYIGNIRCEGHLKTHLRALIYTGQRPTFKDTKRRVVEVFVPSLSLPEFYGKRVCVSFEHFVRGEMVFPSEKALREQVQRDLEVFLQRSPVHCVPFSGDCTCSSANTGF